MGFILLVVAVIVILKLMADSKYRKLEAEVLKKLGFSSWNIISHIDAEVTVKSQRGGTSHSVIGVQHSIG